MAAHFFVGFYKKSGRKALPVPYLAQQTGKIKLTVDRNSGKIEFGKMDLRTG